MAFSPDGKTIAAGYGTKGGGGGVVLWDLAARKRLIDEPLSVKEGEIQSVVFSPNGKTIAAGYNGGRNGGVVLWDVAARKRLVDEPLPVKEGSSERGLQPGRQDHRGRHATAAVWCCGTWPLAKPGRRATPRGRGPV